MAKLPGHYEEAVTVERTWADVRRSVQDALEAMGARDIVATDSQVRARTRVNWNSWGARLRVSCRRESRVECQLTISSSPRFWEGINERSMSYHQTNVRTIRRSLRS
jgi:hypothetical protein